MQPKGIGEIAERLRRSTVRVLSGNNGGGGSGVIWSPEGSVITNAHVLRGIAPTVELWDGRAFPAEIMSRDERRDLAALRIDTAGLEAAAPRDSEPLRAGELVLAVGNPLGFIGALTMGVVHAVAPVAGLGRYPWVQASIRLAPGNSGGPLADASGRVAGINTMIARGGIALAVPAAAVGDFLRNGPRPALGVVVRPVKSGAHAEFGLLVLEVVSNSPAQRASIFPGDVIIGAGSRRFSSLADLDEALDSATGGLLSLSFLRGGGRARREVAIDLTARRREAA